MVIGMPRPLALRGARVSVVESTEVRCSDDFAELVFDPARFGSVPFEGQVATAWCPKTEPTILAA